MSESIKENMEKKNPMRDIQIDKVVLSTCVGDRPDQLEKIATTYREFTGQECKQGIAKKTIRQWEVRRSKAIAVYVTLQKQLARDVLYKAICAKEFTFKDSNVTPKGHFNFGLREHIDLGIKYNPSVGIFGLNLAIVLRRKGFRVSERKIKKGKVGKKQLITHAEAKEWLENEFNVTFSN